MKISKLILVLFLIFLSISVFGWSRHNLITRIILTEATWLEKYNEITVTPYTYTDTTINPEFKIYYELSEEMKKKFPEDGKFFDYYKEDGSYYGYIGKKVGEKTSAYEILCDYSDEPDWDMDKNMHHAFNQKFMGGPQGFRHMYYPFGSFKAANIIFAQGDTPNRVEFYFEKSREAFAKGDRYWGFRFLARCIHYLEDVSNPYHTKQTSSKFIHWNDPVASTTTVTANYHAVWEVYFANVLTYEYKGKTSSHPMIPFLRKGKIEKVKDPKSLTKQTARKSCALAKKCFKTSIEFFGKDYDVLVDRYINEDEFTELYYAKGEKEIQQKEIHDLCSEAYVIASGAVLSFLEYSAEEFKLR
mgnify:CR=1 FL=1